MSELTVLQAIEHRRSTKHFKPDPLEPTVLNTLIDAAAEAPSSFNLQPWRVVLVMSDEQKSALSAAAWNQPQIVEAPVTFVFGASLNGWRETLPQTVETARAVGAWGEKMANLVSQQAPKFQEALGERLREYAIKDAMIAATHVALAAESLGLGSCYMNGWIEDQVKTVIGAGDDPDFAVAVLLPVGVPLETPKHPGRLARKRLFFRDRVSQPFVMRIEALRSPRQQLMGVVHLGRLIDKVRLAQNGSLPGYNYLNAGLDKYVLDLLGLTPTAFVEAVRSNPDDAAVVRWIETNAKRLSDEDKDAFNKRLLSFGPTDEARAARFRHLLDSIDPERADVKTFLELIDLAEGRL